MKAYNETWLRNQYALSMAQRWKREGLLNDSQWNDLKQLHAEVPHNPNIFIKIGLFLFGGIAFCFGAGMVFVVLGEGVGFAATSLVYAVGVFFLLRLLIKQNRFHFSGIDNALIYGIIGAILPAVFEIYSGLKLTSAWSGVALIMPILLAIVYIFSEPLVAVGMLGSGLFIIASWLVQTAWGKALLPFALMLVTGGLYGAIRWFLQKPSSFYWQTALEWVRIASLVVFYLAGNYGFVREANAQLNGLSSPAPEIPFAAIFWLLTFGVPALYLYGGIKQRDRSLLFLGSVAVVCSVITLHQYHPFLSVEWMMIGGGLLLVGSTYRLIKGLKQPKAGFVSVADAEQEEHVGLEAVVLAQLTQQTQNADHGVRLGGGDFGGGGAGDQY